MANIKVFVASPRDVAIERKLVAEVARSLNNEIRDERGVELQVQGWEADVRPRLHPDGAQGPINHDLPVEQFDIVVGIFWQRFGTSIPKLNNETGTEHELRRAIRKSLANNGKPEVVVFFNQTPVRPKDVVPKQADKLRKFRAELKGYNKDYEGAPEFKDEIRSYFIKYLLQHFPLTHGTTNPLVADDPSKYLEWLVRETGTIDVKGLKFGDNKVYQFPIKQFYIPLTTSSGHGTIPLEEALQRPRMLIVGDPGAGKSTFLKRVAYGLCGDYANTGILPLWIGAATLSDYVTLNHRKSGPADPGSPDWIPLFLGAQCQEKNRDLDDAYFRAKLKAGQCRVLIDGLDEASDGKSRNTLLRLIRDAARDYDKCRFVVTSRPEGKAAIEDFDEALIGDLERPEVEAFLGKLAGKLYEADPDKAAAFRDELLGAVDSRREIRKMARNPVMLTALAVLQHNAVKLPEKRVDLYQSILEWLAKARDMKTGRPKGDECLLRLRELALAMQNHAEGRKKQVELSWAGEVLARHFGGREKAESFLRAEQNDSGIVVSRGSQGKELAYWHLTFQEYLAALEVAGWEDGDQHRLMVDGGKLYLPEWRETALLYAGLLNNIGPPKVDALLKRVLDKMGPKPGFADRAKSVGVIGAMLRDLVGHKVSDQRYAESLRLVMDIFDAEKSKEVSFADRLSAAEALGQAGDPRLGRHKWVLIAESKKYRIGATKAEDPDADTDEKPRVVDLGPYRIGKYPVTVSQYAGYVEETGDKPDEWEKQQEHPYWPVVYVNWHQATAYAKWAGGRLPSEEEWERAARGPKGTKYPWGNEKIDTTRANYKDGKVGHPTPVGLYPSGASAEGVLDLIGNVWEWTSSKYDSESYVMRGGGFWNEAKHARPSFRFVLLPVRRDFNGGVRLAWGIT